MINISYVCLNVCLSEIETLLTDLKYTCTDNWVRNIHFRLKKKFRLKKLTHAGIQTDEQVHPEIFLL
jgi:hypothetical protein